MPASTYAADSLTPLARSSERIKVGLESAFYMRSTVRMQQ